MGKLALIHRPPQRFLWKVVIDSRGVDVDSLLTWIRDNCSGDCFYMETRFANVSLYRVEHNRKRNFKDGYLQYTFWFAKKSDATLCRMFWEIAK